MNGFDTVNMHLSPQSPGLIHTPFMPHHEQNWHQVHVPQMDEGSFKPAKPAGRDVEGCCAGVGAGAAGLGAGACVARGCEAGAGLAGAGAAAGAGVVDPLGATAISRLLLTFSSLSGELRSITLRTAAFCRAIFTSEGDAPGCSCRQYKDNQTCVVCAPSQQPGHGGGLASSSLDCYDGKKDGRGPGTGAWVWLLTTGAHYSTVC